VQFPVFIRFGAVALHPHWVFEALAYAGGLYWCARDSRRHHDVVDTRTRWRLIAAALAGGLIGSRVVASFEDPRLFVHHWHDTAYLLSGKTIVGGLIGGLVAVEWAKRRLGVTVPTGDALTIPLIAGLAVGRVGCFLSGLADQSYGIATRLPWGVDFGDGVSRHPTQLYEIGFLCAVAALLVTLGDRVNAVGDRFKLFLFGYLAFRLLVDFIKPGVRLGGLSAIQWVCLGTLAFYAPHGARLAARMSRG
jgi:phosphatidylglycerol:prolipoprotein diacylglycerol transferase